MSERKRLLFGRMAEWNGAIKRNLDNSLYDADYLSDNPQNHDFADYDAFIPQHYLDHEIIWQRQLKNAIAPDKPHAILAGHKMRFNSWAIQHGFSELIPEIYSEQPRFPCILKRARDAFGRHTKIVHSKAELDALLATGHYEHAYCQGLIPGKREYTTHLVSHLGKIEFAVTFEFSFEDDHYVKGQANTGHLTNEQSKHPVELKELISALGYSGISCFNYKLVAGKPMIFEMNPRFGGSLPRAINSFLASYLRSIEMN